MRSLFRFICVTIMAAVAIAAVGLFAKTFVWAPTPATATVAGAPTGAVAPASFIAWEPSFEAALERARATNKPVLVDFYTDWCPHCKEMDNTFAAPEVVALAGNLVTVRVNAEQRTDIAAQYGVRSYPTIMALHSNGAIQTQFSGTYPPDGFVRWLRSTFPGVVPS